MYLLGVLGMLMYSASQGVIIWCVKLFVQGDSALLRQHPEQLLFQLPLAVIGLFVLRGLGDYMANYFPGWVGRQVIKSLRGELFAHVHAPADRVLRPRVVGGDADAADLQHRAGGRGRRPIR